MLAFADNEKHWIDRHKELEGSLASVGKIGTPEKENIQRYARKKRRIADLLREMDALDMLGKTVLDAGCGIGLLSELFFALGARVSGLDTSDVAIAQAINRASPPGYPQEGSFTTASLVSFDFAAQFDFIFCLDVLYHVIDDDNWRTVIENFNRHLKYGGHLILIDHTQEQIESPAAHVRFRTEAMYRSTLTSLGLTKLDFSGNGIMVFTKN